MKIGVFALQGSFKEHINMLQNMEVVAFEVRTVQEADQADAVILPGGESTTLLKLLKKTELDKWLKEAAQKDMPIYGTCAGAIILAQLGLVDIDVKRNAYGRQQDSFEVEIDFQNKKYPGIFIRAPKFTKVGKSAKILAQLDNEPVLLRQKNLLIGSFHPELTKNDAIHRYFIGLTK